MKRIQDLFNNFQAVLSIYLTNKCNLKCGHCAVNSGPEESSLLDLSLVVPLIKQGILDGRVKAIHVSGGEPFLYQNLLKELSVLSNSGKILFCINTNAFWAKNELVAKVVLSKLPGLTQLILSTDVYHESFLPIYFVRNAAKVSVEMGILTQITVCTETGQRSSFVDKLLDVFGSELSTKVEIGVAKIDPVGRAALLPIQQPRKDTFIPKGKCQQINRPVIVENGDIMACCNTCVYDRCRNSPLIIGKVSQRELSSLHSASSESFILQAIRCIGPSFLANILIENKLGARISQTYVENDICGLCSDIMSQDELVSVIKESFSKMGTLRREVAIARAVEYGETEMLKCF